MVASKKLLESAERNVDSSAGNRLGPRARIENRDFDFGTVAPFQAHRHEFQIRNTGDTPLTLFSNGTTCNCLELDIDPHTVLPDKSATVTVIWEAQATDEEMVQRAAVETNDPTQSVIEFNLRGTSRLILAAEPPVLSAPRIRANQSTRLETKVVSPEWSDFELDALPSNADVSCTLKKLEQSELDALKVKSGWHLAVELPPNLPPGIIREHVRLTARRIVDGQVAVAENDQHAEIVEREIPIEGYVLSRLTAYGKDVDIHGSIDAGTLDADQGYQATFTIKVNDNEPNLVVTNITAEPSFIGARLEPYSEAGNPGLYRLHVHIPPSDRPAAYRGEKQGKLTISFDHPRISKLDLGIDFIVKKSFKRGVDKRAAPATHGP